MSEWNEEHFGSLGRTFSGLSGKSKDDFGRGRPYIPYLNVFENSKIDVNQLDFVEVVPGEKQNAVQYGDLLFTTSSETVEEVGMTSVLLEELDHTYLNSFCFGFRLHNFDTLLPDFAPYLFRSQAVRKAISILGQGSTRYNLPKTILLERLHLQLPTLPVQRKIARILTTLDDLIEKTEALIAKYQVIEQGLMHDLFTRGVDEYGHLRPSYEDAPELYKESELGWIPKEWDVVGVSEVGSVKLGRQRSPKHQSGKFTTPYLRVANVFDGWIDYSDVLEMDFTPGEKETFSLLPGDILLNEGQSLELVGRSAVYEGEPDRFCFQNTLVRFRTYPPNSYRFCRSVFKHWLDTARFTTVARQTTSVAHLGADRFAKMLFSKPDAEEQVRIADALSSHNTLITGEERRREKLRETKTGLMQDLLTGEVEVTVDTEE